MIRLFIISAALFGGLAVNVKVFVCNETSIKTLNIFSEHIEVCSTINQVSTPAPTPQPKPIVIPPGGVLPTVGGSAK